MIWTAAYVGLGYSLGSSPEFTTSFLGNLTALVLSLVMLVGALLVASGFLSEPHCNTAPATSSRYCTGG
jgi:membrane protein DedA with SNARE-associated domain